MEGEGNKGFSKFYGNKVRNQFISWAVFDHYKTQEISKISSVLIDNKHYRRVNSIINYENSLT